MKLRNHFLLIILIILLIMVALVLSACKWPWENTGSPTAPDEPLFGELEAGFEASLFTPLRDAAGVPLPGEQCRLEASAIARGGSGHPYGYTWSVPWLLPGWQRMGYPDRPAIEIYLPDSFGRGALFQVSLMVEDTEGGIDQATGEARLDCLAPQPAAGGATTEFSGN